MNKRILFVLIFTILLIGCSKEAEIDITNQQITTNLTFDNVIKEKGKAVTPDCRLYNPRINHSTTIPAKIYKIIYTSTLSLSDIQCLRMEYFERFTCLYLASHQTNTDPYQEMWELLPCDPDGSEEIDESIDEDDRLED